MAIALAAYLCCIASGVRHQLYLLHHSATAFLPPQAPTSGCTRTEHRSFAPVKAFTTATGVKPDVVVYYSGWQEPFQTGFATTAAKTAPYHSCR